MNGHIGDKRVNSRDSAESDSHNGLHRKNGMPNGFYGSRECLTYEICVLS